MPIQIGGTNMRSFIAAVLLCTTSPLASQIATPDRPVTDPKSLTSLARPEAHGMSVDPVNARASAIRDTFVAAIRRCGVTPTFVPLIKIDTDPSLVSYLYADRSVHLSRWVDLPPPLKEFIDVWTAQGTMGLEPEQMFREIFNDFLVAHELGHYLAHMSGRSRTLDPTDSETEANQIALAYWSLNEADRAKLPLRYENFTKFLLALPNPVPEGQNPSEYLARNYSKVSQDGLAYGWYQGRFLKDAWGKRSERDFCSWVKINSPIPVSEIEK
jgi:hypothetical protein